MKSMSSSDALTAKAARLDALAPARRTAAPRTDALAESTRGLKVTAAMWKVGGVAESGCPTVDESAKTRRVARVVARTIQSLLFERFFRDEVPVTAACASPRQAKKSKIGPKNRENWAQFFDVYCR